MFCELVLFQGIRKTFSVQLLRILYAMRNRDVIESAKEVSDKLLHSQAQSLQYAKKSPKKSPHSVRKV